MLPPETGAIWDFLKAQPVLAGFVLIGGSALALRIGHRRSEDLDLAWLERRLPRRELETLKQQRSALEIEKAAEAKRRENPSEHR